MFFILIYYEAGISSLGLVCSRIAQCSVSKSVINLLLLLVCVASKKPGVIAKTIF
jgi:hypothetical protein